MKWLNSNAKAIDTNLGLEWPYKERSLGHQGFLRLVDDSGGHIVEVRYSEINHVEAFSVDGQHARYQVHSLTVIERFLYETDCE